MWWKAHLGGKDLPFPTLQTVHCKNDGKSAQKSEHNMGEEDILELQMSSGRMCDRQPQNEVPTFAFLVNQELFNSESQTTEARFQIR